MDTTLVKSRWEEDFELIPNEGLFEEYLEMGIVLHIYAITQTSFFNHMIYLIKYIIYKCLNLASLFFVVVCLTLYKNKR